MSGIRIHPFQLKFKRPAKTSRNTLLEKQCYLLTYGTPLRAVGECNFFQGLSADDPTNYDSVLKGACKRLEDLFKLEALSEDERFDQYSGSPLSWVLGVHMSLEDLGNL